MDAEVHDLKQGYAAIEERARSELGMVKQDEVFYQLIDENNLAKPNPAPPSIQPPVKPSEPAVRATKR